MTGIEEALRSVSIIRSGLTVRKLNPRPVGHRKKDHNATDGKAIVKRCCQNIIIFGPIQKNVSFCAPRNLLEDQGLREDAKDAVKNVEANQCQVSNGWIPTHHQARNRLKINLLKMKFLIYQLL